MTTFRTAPAPVRDLARGRGPYPTVLTLAVVALLLKLPQLVVSVLSPAGIEGWVPAGGALATFAVAVAWLVFTVVLLGLRTWVGALSAVWFCVLSTVSAVGFLGDGLLLWGGVQLLTSATVLFAVLLAVVHGAFKGSRW